MMYLALVLWTSFGNGPIKSIAQISKVILGFMDINEISWFFNGQPSLWRLSHFMN